MNVPLYSPRAQLPVLAPGHGKSAARIEFSENGKISIRAFREFRLVISIARSWVEDCATCSSYANSGLLCASSGLSGSRFSNFLAPICTLSLAHTRLMLFSGRPTEG